MNTFSFRELSALGSLIAITVAYALYFNRIFGVIAGGEVPDRIGVIAYAAGIVGILVAIEIVYHAVLATRFRNEPMDERDRSINARSHQYAYGVLIFGAVLVTGHLMFSDSGVIAAQFLLLAIVVAEAVKYAATFALYRLSV